MGIVFIYTILVLPFNEAQDRVAETVTRKPEHLNAMKHPKVVRRNLSRFRLVGIFRPRAFLKAAGGFGPKVHLPAKP